MQPLLARVSGRFARNGISMLGNQLASVGVQAAYFVLLARALRVEQFGTFAAVAALVSIVAPFGNLGSLNLMIRRLVTGRGSESGLFGGALIITTVTSAVIAMVLLALGRLVAAPGAPVFVVAMVIIADLFGARIVALSGGVFQARDRMFRTALFSLALYGSRLVVIVVLSTTTQISLTSWSAWYASSTVALTIAITVYTYKIVGVGRPTTRLLLAEWRDGIHFSIAFSAQSVYNDIDKAMLGRLSTATATGVYSTAYRLIDTAFIPARSLLAAAYTNFFRKGAAADGLRSTVNYARRLAKPGMAYCLIASCMLYVLAPVVPKILGASFSGSTYALRGLAILLPLKMAHYLAADSLSGAGLQRVRTRCQVSIAVLNVGLNIWLIPKYGLDGAIISSIASDASLAIVLWTVVYTLLSRAPTHSGKHRRG